jgi:hypothetical protein
MVISVLSQRYWNFTRMPVSRFLSCTARHCNQIWTPPGAGDKTVQKNRSESKSENKLLNQVTKELYLKVPLRMIWLINGCHLVFYDQ